MARPRVLLAESSPAVQLKLERILRRNGYESDLAVDGQEALRLACRDQPYGVLLASAEMPQELLQNVATAVRRLCAEAVIIGFNSGASSVGGGAGEAVKQGPFLEECGHVFPYL